MTNINTTDKEIAGSLAAMKRAALAARKLAIQTNTGIVMVKDNKTIIVTAEELIKEGYGK